MANEREKQLAYSEIQYKMSQEESRVRKAKKISAVLDHLLGPNWAQDAVFLDIGSSLGWTVEAAALRGARAIGVDIDVPGLAGASRGRDPRCFFACADGEQLPFQDESVDIVVLNHIYEHVVNPEAVMREIYRVLKPSGVAYLGLGNKLGIIEPHYRLPFLSYLPDRFADRYVRAFKKADNYHERFRTLGGLKKMVADFQVLDYSFSIVAHPEVFASGDVVNKPVTAAVKTVPAPARRLARTIIPTFIWLASKRKLTPKGAALEIAPERVDTSS
ncbi:MAG: class I SAM-dependent methyltransferase [Actinomycetota bacterium]|nr:class I SAM-dependent methyltransferase [Actinomycetota bacterium]